MFNVIVFSKNRACQLDWFLRTLQLKWPEVGTRIMVVHRADTRDFQRGYDILENRNPTVGWINENRISAPFKDVVLSCISLDNDHTVFFVDDNVFIAPFDSGCKQFVDFAKSENSIAFSLRLGQNIQRCFAYNSMRTPPPKMDEFGKFCWWRLAGDWGYPMSMAGHVFRTGLIRKLLELMPFKNPNSLEGGLMERRRAFRPMPFMHCCETSRIVNFPMNMVQGECKNRIGLSVSPEQLNEMFLDGLVVDSARFEGFIPLSPHMGLKKLPFVDC